MSRYVVEHITSRTHSSVRTPFFGVIDTHEGARSWRKFTQHKTRKSAQARADHLNSLEKGVIVKKNPKRKAPSASSMQKALATFKARHPGAPIPGFLRKYAKNPVRPSRSKRKIARRKNPVRPLKLRSSTQHPMLHTRPSNVVSNAKANPKVKRFSTSAFPYHVRMSLRQDGPEIDFGRYRTLAAASKIAKWLGKSGAWARVAKSK
jgi:hypothetical protein